VAGVPRPQRPAALVVEDHAFQRRALCRLLQQAGVEHLLEAEDGESALALLRASGAASSILVITDLDMPNMDGIEFIRRLAGERLPLQLVIYSSQDAAVLRSVHRLAEDLGLRLAGLLCKPATLVQIEALLDDAARGPSTAAREGALALSADDVRDAFKNGSVIAYFQPKLSLKEERAVGCEVLARLVHPKRGVLRPEHFMAALEGERLQQALTDRMLGSALALLAQTRAIAPDITVSVNLTLPEVSLPRDAERLAGAVAAAGIAPRSITLEVTETAVATDWALAVENLSRLRMKGFNLSIDDFGTGYSSLQQLLRLPFSELKVDQSFVRGIAQGSAAYSLVESTLGMAEKLGLSTVAEGIETPMEARTLRDLRCDLGQGYAFAKPMPADDFIGWLRGRA
jgi:EAL domain-containing protein (putative c-di-GMP-specific phosphodiesterase class I)/ActR/RegA family two-component response regulator